MTRNSNPKSSGDDAIAWAKSAVMDLHSRGRIGTAVNLLEIITPAINCPICDHKPCRCWCRGDEEGLSGQPVRVPPRGPKPRNTAKATAVTPPTLPA